MLKKDLVDFIEKELNKGIHIDRIKDALFNVGHQIEHVEEAIIHVEKKKKKRFYVMISIIVIAFLILVIGFGLILDNALEEKEEEPPLVKEQDNNNGQATSEDFIKKEREDQVIFRNALKSSNVTLCDGIGNSLLKENCVNLVKK